MKTRLSKRNIFGNYAKELTKLEKDMDLMVQRFLNLEITTEEYDHERKLFMEKLHSIGLRMTDTASMIINAI